MATQETLDTLDRTHLFAIGRWFALVAVAFTLVAVGMTWLARSVPVASPIDRIVTGAGLDAAPAGAPTDSYPRPDFRLASLDGGQLGPPDYAGNVVLLEIWATWCGPCRLQADFIDEVHREFENRGVRFLAVNLGEDEATVREFAEKKPFSFPVLLDPEETVGRRYQIYGLPTVMIVDRQGEISFLRTGVSPTAMLRDQLIKAGASGGEA